MPIRATDQDGTYPRPQLLREEWTDLSGTWQLAFDDERVGQSERWQQLADMGDRSVFDRDVVVPFPPESPASGIGDTSPHPVIWYRRTVRLVDVPGTERLASGHRLVLRLGAVDYRAQVWLDGMLVGSHQGGQTPWHIDLTGALDHSAVRAEHVLVVCAEDDPRDVAQPRGKQDWYDDPHAIWYFRTSGIWQPVWLEVVPALAVDHLAWIPDLPAAAVRLEVTLSAAPPESVTVAVRLELSGRLLAEQTVRVAEQRIQLLIGLPALVNGQAEQDFLWSPEDPRLVDAQVRVLDDRGATLDEVASYLGLRSAGVDRGAFLLNGIPYYVRSVLSQGYWPESHLAAPNADALREEVELIAALGFNAVRVHQKAEDPRFLHWCDRLGVLVWGETANAYAFTPEAVRRLTTEWMDLVHRDISHPSIVTWVPLNESWGVHHIASQRAQQHYATGLAALTRALDPSRPVVSNDGYEHTDSDLCTVHDYAETGAELTRRYDSPEAFARETAGFGQRGRRIRVNGANDLRQPVMLTEFGGLRYTPGGEPEQANCTWGYSTVTTAALFCDRLTDWFDAIRASTVLAGFCYTQLADTLQEANGLLDERRNPKIPIEQIRAVVTGERNDAHGVDAVDGPLVRSSAVSWVHDHRPAP